MKEKKMRHLSAADKERLKGSKEELERIAADTLKQRHRRTLANVVKDLHRFGYNAYPAMNPEVKKVFDILTESPFLDQRLDAGSLIKIALDTITEAEIREIRKFVTHKKKELWIFESRDLTIFKFERGRLAWPRNMDQIPSHFIRKADVVKEKVSQKSD